MIPVVQNEYDSRKSRFLHLTNFNRSKPIKLSHLLVFRAFFVIILTNDCRNMYVRGQPRVSVDYRLIPINGRSSHLRSYMILNTFNLFAIICLLIFYDLVRLEFV